MIPTTGSATGADQLDLTKYNYPAGLSSLGNAITGSSGPKSSELCVSVFGLQDFAANGKEALSDRVKCNNDATYCYTRIIDKTNVEYPQNPTLLSSSDLYTPEIDPQSIESSRNGNGRYLNFALSSVSNSLGSPYVDTTTPAWADPPNLLTTNPTGYKYFSPTLGLMLSCSGTSCLVDGASGGNDDNTLATTLSTSSIASILNFNPNGSLQSNQAQYPQFRVHYLYANNQVTFIWPLYPTLPFLTSGQNGDGTKNGRYYINFNSGAAPNTFNNNIYGRCSTLIENYSDQAAQYNQ